MGAKESKCTCITYEAALKEVKEDELKHLKEAFKRNSSQNGYITKHCFTKEILGDTVPAPLAERIYVSCGGTTKGIAFKDLLCGLVLFNRGTFEQKCEFLFNIYSNESGSYITKTDFHKFILSIESTTIDSDAIAALFSRDDKVTLEEFVDWMGRYRDVTSLSRWLFSESNPISLNNKPDIPTFYQTLAGVTHLEEADIIDLEKVYWNLKEQSKSGKLDLETLLPMICPPLPLSVCASFFNVFDENRDGHIDFKEMACGISAACRGPLTERQKFCFKIFDTDRDGFLSEKDIDSMVDILLFVHKENTYNRENIDKEVVLEDIRSHRSGEDPAREDLTLEEYVIWTVHNNISMDFLNLIYQVCHIVLGLKPVSRQEEGKIVRGWMQREERRGYLTGQFWCLIAIEWWHSWEHYVTSPLKSVSTCSSFDYKAIQDSPGRSYSMTFLSNYSPGSFSRQSSPTFGSQRGGPGRPGPIDNSSLIIPNSYKIPTLTGEGGKLKKNLQQIHDYELVPESLWKALKRWYGASLCIPRQVIKPPNKNEIELELYPLTLRVLRHQAQPAANNRVAYPQTNSWSGMAGGYGAAALMSISASSYSYGSNTSAVPKRYVAHTATFSRLATIRHVYNYLCNRLKIRPEDVRLWQFDDENNMKLIEDEDFTLEKLDIHDDDQMLMEVRNKDLTWPEEISSLATNSTERNKHTATERGATGLNNLGNTCFMNAALQCVSNTQTLTLYFIRDMHLYELNRVNPLGMKGHIAKRYGDLIHDIWSGTAKTIAPLKLRWTISKYAPQFNGFQQHDSQELLAFLLDGLHEDLNRVHDKPYLELKDSECRPDVAVAQEAWENHILRNKSIIIDLFHGQLKSKVTCKVCGHESVRFDPFNYLSLPLPMESYICIQVIVIKLNGTVPMKFSLRLNADDTYGMVKQQLTQRCSIPSYLLKLVQINGSNIKTVLTDDQKVKPLQNGSNFVYAYELPTTCASSGSISGDEERLSISSIKSTHREAAQTFTAIQRLVRPGSQANLGMPSGQIRTISEDSSDSAINSCSNGEICCSESSESNSSPADCSEILLEEMSGRLTADSGHCSASSASLADSTDTTNGNSQQPSYIVALHRKMIRQDVYFVSSQKTKPSLFGFPVIVPCSESTTNAELYQSVWLQVARFVSPLPPTETTGLNHAIDCDYSLGYEFPFRLKAVNKDGSQCAWCPWYRFCRGCEIQCCDSEFAFSSSCIAIDWDPTALHLRYQTSQESEYECIGEQFSQKSSEPLDLKNCLEAFTTEEHLSDDEKYYCSKCKAHQPASKKLQIWRLPPVLIIHLKRFQFMNGKWVKSQKVVKFPSENLDLTDYLAAVPQETINRYRELKLKKNKKLKEKSIISDSEVSSDTDSGLNFVHNLSSINNTSSPIHSNCNGIPCDANPERFQDFGSNERADLCDETNNNKKMFDIGDLCQKRKRLESTSLSRTPIDDTALQDFHQHRLKHDDHVFDLKYNLYAVVCHSGILGGGHYVSYACNPNGKWYCYNDSSCREVNDDMDTSCAYMLFYEREGLDHERYLPNVAGKSPLDVSDLDQDFESDYKKMCHLM